MDCRDPSWLAWDPGDSPHDAAGVFYDELNYAPDVGNRVQAERARVAHQVGAPHDQFRHHHRPRSAT